MSFSATSWAWRTRPRNAIARVVLLYLADCADRNGECFPSVETICRATLACDQAVRKAIAGLIEDHLIERDYSPSRHGHLSPRYRLPVAVATEQPFAEPNPPPPEFRSETVDSGGVIQLEQAVLPP